MKVLFLAANPLDTGRLALDEEIRAIQQKVASSPNSSWMEFVAVWAARPDDLLQAINEHQPTIIHFVGHATSDGLEAVGEDRRARPITNEALLRVLALRLAASVRLVVLNACYSAPLAEQIEQTIGCAVGISGPLEDQAASAFSSSFFRAIGFGSTIREAVEQGCASMLLEGFDNANAVRLHCAEPIALTCLFPRPGPPQALRPDEHRASIPLLDEVGATDYIADRLAEADKAYLLFMDVDGLLGINMVYGDTVGDLVIARCCELVAGYWSLTFAGSCRVRGDQFLILDTFRKRSSWGLRPRGKELVKQIRDQDWTALGRDLHVTVTAAGAEWERGEDPASLLLRAILGVKEAKRRGWNPSQPIETVATNFRTENGGVVPDRVYFLSEISRALS